jgi:hypothetical protein
VQLGILAAAVTRWGSIESLGRPASGWLRI